LNVCFSIVSEDEMTLTSLALILGVLMNAPEPKPAAATVLFVCEHGSAKSVVAAAHFNQIAEARGLPFRAISRGTVPDAEMAPAAVEGLRGDGLKPEDPAPSKLEQADLDAAVRVVAFCALPPGLQARSPVEQWEVPPVSTEYAASRKAMLLQIERLLRELAGPGVQ
jgi:protein-tyrosine-phosphatase